MEVDLGAEQAIQQKEMERCLDILQQAIQQKEMLSKTIMQCVFIGIPRSGKTSLMKRIVGEDLPRISPSTGVAEKAVQVVVRPSAASVNEFDSTWTKLNKNEEAAIIIMDTSRCHSVPIGHDPTPVTDTVDSDPTPAFDTSQSHLDKVRGDSTLTIDTSQSCLNPTLATDTSQTHLSTVDDNSTTSEAVAAVPQSELSMKVPIDVCRRALENAEKILQEPGWLVYLTDTGGQIEFQELLPQLLSGRRCSFWCSDWTKNSRSNSK